MENLVKYTTKLIAQHNCVIIPGLGAFLAHNVPASYNAEDGIFMPPHRKLGFNPQVRIDDALLLSEYIDEQQLSYDEAAKRMRNDVSALRHTLSQKGCARMGELGTFNMNVKGEISFIPDPNGIDDPYNFGLEPLLMPLLADCEKKEIVIKRHTFRKYVSIAAAIIVGLFLVIPIGNSLYEPSMQAGIPVMKSKTATVASDATVHESVAPVQQATAATNTVAESKTATADIAPQSTVAATTDNSMAKAVAEDAPVFSIIVASSPNEANAQLAISELSAKMQAEYSVVKASGRYRIAHSTYSSNAEAMSALTQIKDTFPDAWVFAH